MLELDRLLVNKKEQLVTNKTPIKINSKEKGETFNSKQSMTKKVDIERKNYHPIFYYCGENNHTEDAYGYKHETIAK